MTEATPAAAAAIVPDNTAKINFEGLTGERAIDCATIPGEARLEILKSGVVAYARNRLNQAVVKYNKNEKVKAFAAYEEAVKADPLQTVVAKPEGEKPTLDLEPIWAGILADLTSGNIRQRAKSGESKPRERKDPLIVAVTKVVVDEVYAARKASNPKYTYIDARKEVGADGIAYLNANIETKVAAGVDRAALEKMRDTKYINPAKVMLGLTENKTIKELPSIL